MVSSTSDIPELLSQSYSLWIKLSENSVENLSTMCFFALEKAVFLLLSSSFLGSDDGRSLLDGSSLKTDIR
jgi:hypothetical protein